MSVVRRMRTDVFRGVARSDAILAGVVAVMGQQEVWRPAAGFSEGVGPRGVVSLTYLVAALALTWRRRAPLTVLVVVAVSLGVDYVAFGAPEGLGTLLPPVISFYSVGRHSDTRRFAIAVAVTLAHLALHEVRDPAYTFTGSTVVFWVIAVGSGFLGLLLRSRDTEIREAAQRAELAEARRDERDREIADAERTRLARELHDVVGHGLSLVVLRLVALDGSLEHGDVATARRHVATLEDAARQTLAETRRLVQVMDAGDGAPTAAQPGLADVPRLVEAVTHSGAQVALRVSGPAERVSPGLGLTAYRVVQEALTNVVRHARPADAQVLVDVDADALTLEVTDRGSGAVSTNGDGRGLRGMRERVALYGGTLEAGPRAGGGFRVRAAFPLPEDLP